MTKVRQYTRIQNGKRVTVTDHDRSARGPGLGRSPRSRRRRTAFALTGITACGAGGAMAGTGGVLAGGLLVLAGAGGAKAVQRIRARRASDDSQTTPRFKTKREQTAYEEGKTDGQATRKTGQFVNTNRRPTERPDDEARAYSLGHGDGQDDQTIPDRRGSSRETAKAPTRRTGDWRGGGSWKEQSLRNSRSDHERRETEEFYRIRESGYTGPIQWDKGQMPRKVDG